MENRLITLLTDFGLSDYFVGSMKGVMLSINPDLTFVDLSHLVPPQDVHTGAFTLWQAYHYFPPGTIHLAVVDPGVGTARKEIAASAGGQFFVAPDNGLLSYVFDREEEFTVHEISAEHYFHKPVSSTFHGRDIFAPVAAWISRDIPLPKFGPVLENPVRLKKPSVEQIRENLLQATILAVDHFGNLVTSLKPGDLPAHGASGIRSCKILAAQREISSFYTTFGQGKTGELFVVPGSAGYLEIAMRGASAASVLNLKPGQPIGVVLA